MLYIFRLLLLFIIAQASFAAVPDFQAMSDYKKRQAAFFKFLLPVANQVNKSILSDREKIKQLHEKWRAVGVLNDDDNQWLRHIAKNYKINELHLTKREDWNRLLRRVDAVPVSMLLAQAANESAWGTSRFAKLGNNFFGQWCFRSGCGFVPKLRPKGKVYEVQRFKNPYESIKSYLSNLNTNASYKQFRQLRAVSRLKQKVLNGYELAQGLINYSERKGRYVKSIRAIISHHHLAKFDIS